MQGNGEVLERVLEKSGLEKDENMRYSKALPPRRKSVFLTL
jgi:hypothetical protein